MKKVINISLIALSLFILASCQDELKDELFYKYTYIVERAWHEYNAEIKDDNTLELLVNFGVNGTSKNDKDITIKVVNDPDTLAAYNFERFKLQTGSYYTELPPDCYAFDKTSYTIKKGEYTTTAKIKVDLNLIQDIYSDYVLPLKIASSAGEGIGPNKCSKSLLHIVPTNKFSGTYSGSGTVKIDGKSQSTSVGSAILYASSLNTCYMYAGNANQSTDVNYKKYAIDVAFDSNDNIVLSSKNADLQFQPIKAVITRKYVLHSTDTRYYIQTSVLTLQYKYKDLTIGENRTLVYSGTHTLIKNVLKTDYPNVVVVDQ
jgi:hypothetical protein